jgi:hypothetical protein
MLARPLITGPSYESHAPTWEWMVRPQHKRRCLETPTRSSLATPLAPSAQQRTRAFSPHGQKSDHKLIPRRCRNINSTDFLQRVLLLNDFSPTFRHVAQHNITHPSHGSKRRKGDTECLKASSHVPYPRLFGAGALLLAVGGGTALTAHGPGNLHWKNGHIINDRDRVGSVAI